MFETLDYVVRDCVAYVTFSTPERLNSITEQRMADLEAAVAAVRADESLRALVLSGSGRAFCVGLDLDLLREAFQDISVFERQVRRLNAILLDLEALPVATIAAVNGIARAGGFEMALACDLLIIADEAKIGDNHTHVGVMPGGGSTQRLPRRIGEQRAKELIWSARWLSGQEAAAIGLAFRSVPLSQLGEAIETVLVELRRRPRATIAVVKRAIHAGRDIELVDGIELEIRAFVEYMGALPYAREGFEASLAGRTPSWL